MKTVLYLDTLLLVNFLIGYLLLRGAGALAGRAPTWRRNLLGGAAASLSTLVLLAPPLPPAAQLGYQALTALAIVALAFGRLPPRPFLRLAVTYLALNLTLAGAVTARCLRGPSQVWHTNNLAVYAGVSPGLLAGCVAGVYGAARLFLLLFGRPRREALFTLGLSVGPCRLEGLRALLVSLPAVEGRLPAALRQGLGRCLEGGEPPPLGIRLLPCRTTFGEGLLPAVTAHDLRVEGPGQKAGREKATLIFSPDTLADGRFEAVFGGELFWTL